ncbi:MAG: hypothetical protein Q8P81_00570 [Nanoarchaeota archaeon]|nr:hypothetical protein [Nanoarchaeota archaeon]
MVVVIERESLREGGCHYVPEDRFRLIPFTSLRDGSVRPRDCVVSLDQVAYANVESPVLFLIKGYLDRSVRPIAERFAPGNANSFISSDFHRFNISMDGFGTDLRESAGIFSVQYMHVSDEDYVFFR